MRWKSLNSSRNPRLDWGRLLDTGRAVDPYLAWADITKFRWLDCKRGDELPFLIEVNNPKDFQARFVHSKRTSSSVPANSKPSFPSVPAAYLVAREEAPSFYTCMVKPAQIAQLMNDSLIECAQLSLPRVGRIVQDEQPSALAEVKAYKQFLGVIDDGCAFAHPKLRDESGAESRVVGLWDQGATTRRHPLWKDSPQMGYGKELDVGEIDLKGFDDAAAGYRRAGYDSLSNKRHAHGTGVTDLAAGWPAPRLLSDGSTSAGGSRDAAGNTPIVFVQLPKATVDDTSGGSLGAHVLDGLHYIIGRARRRADGKPLDRTCRIVVNVSFGALAGPHDGSTLLERAMAELLGLEDDKLEIVVAAGNARRFRAHMDIEFGPDNRSASCQLSVAPDNPLRSFVEVWFPDNAQAYTLSVSGPGLAPGKAGYGNAQQLVDDNGAVIAALIFARRVVQGLNGTMALLAIAPTRADEPVRAPHGIWSIALHYEGSDPSTAQIWVERNDLLKGTRRDQQTSLVTDQNRKLKSEATQSNLASGEKVWVAGATEADTGRVADYSSLVVNTQGRRIREVVVPVDRSSGRRGIRVAGIAAAAVGHLSGTSAAAPRAARALLNGTLRAPPPPPRVIGQPPPPPGKPIQLSDDLEQL